MRKSILPHKVGTADIQSAELKKIAMQFMENFKALEKKIETLQNEVKKLQEGR